MTTEQKNEMEKAGTRGGGNGWTYIPDADIYESDKEYLVALTMPGVSEKSVDVAVENNVLTVRGTLETGTPEGYRVVRVEHGAGRYERAFTLSDDITNLVPKWRGSHRPSRRGTERDLLSFQKEMNRLFDEIFNTDDWFGAGWPGLAPAPRADKKGLAPFVPKVDVSETDTEVKISAELPGLDKDEVTVEVDDTHVTLKGEKREEHEDKGEHWHSVEQSYGSFHRVIPLPAEVDGVKAKAKFKKGVLAVTLPKLQKTESKRKEISVDSE
jgi:HSP20 family protein